MKSYTTANKVSVLISGGPGVGKSTIGELLAAEMKKKLCVAPEVVKCLDLTAPGFLLEDALKTSTVTTPVILMLDEFDTTIDYAERDRSKDGRSNEGISLANTPTSLLGLLDRMNKIHHFIIIATTNQTLAEMTSNKYERHTRNGRFNMHITADANMCYEVDA